MRTLIIMLIAAILGGCTGSNKDKKQFNVLVVTDERKFNREAFFAMFDSFENIRWTESHRSQAVEMIGSGSIRDYDAVVFYDMPEKVELSREQKQWITRYFKEGAPVVFLHHAILSYRPWDGFVDIIGGRYYNIPAFVTNKGDTVLSEYQHDVHFNVKIADAKHPITKGMADFEIFDETYNKFYVKDDVKVLLTTDHPSCNPTIGWVNAYGKSQVVYLMNGHNETAYENPHFRQLLSNAIRWVASNHR
jgi:uncharacterized protein